MTTLRRTFGVVCLPRESATTASAVSTRSSASRGRATAVSFVAWLLILLWSGHSANASSLVPQTPLDGNCVPKFAVRLPVFGPAGSVPRVDAFSHPYLTVTMKEVDQAVLPIGIVGPCAVTFARTRVWAFETADSNTGAVLGPANWPAVTIVARRGTPTQVEYVNQLPSFNPSDPNGPGLVQGLLPFDQTLHWADPLQSGCGMQHHQCSQSLNLWEREKMVDFEDKGSLSCDGRILNQPGDIRPISYSMASYADSASPCCQQYIGPVPATVHLHGAELVAAYDGDPDSWFTPNGLTGPDYHTIGNPGPGKAIYEYANTQEAGTLWFHDHALGITRINVYAGLAGYYFLKDPDREPKGYPSGAYEIEMAVQDRLFDSNSQLYFPTQTQLTEHPFWSVNFEGDVATVNGAAFPYLNVEPRRYRFHLLNGTNHRGFIFTFDKAVVHEIGADDNYFDKPVPVTTVSVTPGGRGDVIVDFSKLAGQTITLTNSGPYMKYQLRQIMQFRVASASKTPDTSCDPANPIMSSGVCARKYPLVRLTDGNGHLLPGVKVDRVRQLVINENVDFPQTITEYVNNTKWNGLESPSIAYDFPSDGVSELPRVGSVELWEIANLSAMTNHPIHIHLSQFQVLNRQNLVKNYQVDYQSIWDVAFGQGPVPLPSTCSPGHYCADYGPPLDYLTANDDGAIGGNPAFSHFLAGNIITPSPDESGWNDTALANGGQVLRLLIRWTPSDVPVVPYQSYAGDNLYSFDPTQGYYIWHCHLLNHEDNEMMRPYRVIK